jgi:hypothetical protein
VNGAVLLCVLTFLYCALAQFYPISIWQVRGMVRKDPLTRQLSENISAIIATHIAPSYHHHHGRRQTHPR